MIDKLKEIRASLRESIKEIEENGGDMTYAHWGMEEGALVSGEDAKILTLVIDAHIKQLELIEGYKAIFGRYPFKVLNEPQPMTDQKNLDPEVSTEGN